MWHHIASHHGTFPPFQRPHHSIACQVHRPCCSILGRGWHASIQSGQRESVQRRVKGPIRVLGRPLRRHMGQKGAIGKGACDSIDSSELGRGFPRRQRVCCSCPCRDLAPRRRSQLELGGGRRPAGGGGHGVWGALPLLLAVLLFLIGRAHGCRQRVHLHCRVCKGRGWVLGHCVRQLRPLGANLARKPVGEQAPPHHPKPLAHVGDGCRHVGRLRGLLRARVGLDLLQLPGSQRQVEHVLLQAAREHGRA